MKGQLATFAAGCFWGVEEIFRRTGKIISCRVGYTGGIVDNPNYRMVCSGETGHAEAIEIEYDPKQTRYEDLLAIFWANHNPTTLNRQGPDVGDQYRSAIFYHTPEQKDAALKSLEAEQVKWPRKIITQVLPATTFYPAEDYHQDYARKSGRSCHL